MRASWRGLGWLLKRWWRLSEELLVEEAKRRAEIFRNLGRYLAAIADVVRGLDGDAEVYLFGSVAEGRYLLSSDIDVLVVTNQGHTG
jgi:predicted nucleotidyltransferase